MFRRGKGVFSKRNVLFIRERRTGYKTVRRYGSKLVLKAMEEKNKSLLSKEKKCLYVFFFFCPKSRSETPTFFAGGTFFRYMCRKNNGLGAVSYNENLTSQF